MRRVTFAGTPAGVTWTQANAGFVRSDSLICEIAVADLLAGTPDNAATPDAFADLAAAGAKPLLLAPAGCEPDTLRRVGGVTASLGTRALVQACTVPRAGTPDLDLLVEQLRTAQDILPLPVVLDPVVRPDQDPVEVARALRELCERVWCTFVLDLSDLQRFAVSRGIEPAPVIANLPPSRVAYVRVQSTTRHPVTSSTRELMLSTMARWEDHPPAIVLRSDRPVSMQVHELTELMEISGHLTGSTPWAPTDRTVRSPTFDHRTS